MYTSIILNNAIFKTMYLRHFRTSYTTILVSLKYKRRNATETRRRRITSRPKICKDLGDTRQPFPNIAVPTVAISTITILVRVSRERKRKRHLDQRVESVPYEIYDREIPTVATVRFGRR